MATPSSVRCYQYDTFAYTYNFDLLSDQTVLLKVQDVFEKEFSKVVTFSWSDLHMQETVPFEKTAPKIIDFLLQKKLMSLPHLASESPLALQEEENSQPPQRTLLPLTPLSPYEAISLQTPLQTATAWFEGYNAISPEKIVVRQWKLLEDDQKPIEILQEIPDHQKPHLPEGYIWFKEGKDLKILRHERAPPPDFKIYLFGPDKKRRVQYIVADGTVPIHGFAMAKKEGFSNQLRDDYPMSPTSFKAGEKTMWRGHIIDYQDTLGDVNENNISTLFSLNYKPEPAGAWARTFRFKLVEKTREEEGSYAEMILYDFSPTKTRGGRSIPEAIFIEKFTYRGDRLNGYYVPTDHACHGWEKKPNEKKFWENSLLKLSQDDTFPALVIDKEALLESVSKKEPLLPSNLELLNIKEAFHLRRMAEMEFNSSTNMLRYALYARTHKASSETVQFWLERATCMATKIDTAYQSKIPAFPLSLMNSITDVFLNEPPHLKNLIDRLKLIATRMLIAPCQPYPVISSVITSPLQERTYSNRGYSDEHKDLSPLSSQTNRVFISPSLPPQTLNAIEISCKDISSRNESTINGLMENLKKSITKGSPIILKDVSTHIGNKILPRIKEASLEKSPDYKPLEKVMVTNPRYLKTMSKVVRNLFGNDVPIE